MTRRKAATWVVVLALLAAAVVISVWRTWSLPGPGDGENVIVRIPPGSSVRSVADTLFAHELLAHRHVFVFGARLTGQDRAIKAGRYAIARGLPPREILDLLTSGRAMPVRVTVLEGSEAVTVAAAVAASFPWTSDAFLAVADSIVRKIAASDPLLMEKVDLETYDGMLRTERLRSGRLFPLCEGYVFPETYHFAEGLSVTDVALTMVLDGLAAWHALGEAGLRDGRTLFTDLHQVLTLASIIEAETPLREEMPKVAAVYLNRLRAGRSLEADPTVAHAAGKRGQRILYVDLKVDSAFNTYRHKGLPPGPICSPGLDAIKAALEPEPGFDRFYFVADGKGGHVFSRTLAEHQSAVETYRRMRKAQGGR